MSDKIDAQGIKAALQETALPTGFFWRVRRVGRFVVGDPSDGQGLALTIMRRRGLKKPERVRSESVGLRDAAKLPALARDLARWLAEHPELQSPDDLVGDYGGKAANHG